MLIGGGSCTNGNVRLVTASSSKRSTGRVEVCINQQWGSVCDDGWDSYDARAACRQLGFYGIFNFVATDNVKHLKMEVPFAVLAMGKVMVQF